MAIEWKTATVDLATNSTEISAEPCLVRGIYVNTVLSAHPCPIKDGTTGQIFTIPSASAAGLDIPFGPARFEENLTVDPDDAATGSITVTYVILGDAHG